jgi:hypothetical protein
VILPKPDDTLSDKVLSSPNLMGSTSRASVPPVTSGQSAGTKTLFGPIIISVGVLIVALIGIWLVMQRQRNAKL